MKTSHRAQRTREQLQAALIELIGERGYNTITIQDIVARAHVGRTTFYLYYESKDDLFVSCHETMVSKFNFGVSHLLSRAELLSPEPPAGMVMAYRHLNEARSQLSPIFQGGQNVPILRRIHDMGAQTIEASLRAAFPQERSTIPLEVLANYLAGAQIALMQWWLWKRQPFTAEHLAQAFHRLQRAAIRDAFGLPESG